MIRIERSSLWYSSELWFTLSSALIPCPFSSLGYVSFSRVSISGNSVRLDLDVADFWGGHVYIPKRTNFTSSKWYRSLNNYRYSTDFCPILTFRSERHTNTSGRASKNKQYGFTEFFWMIKCLAIGWRPESFKSVCVVPMKSAKLISCFQWKQNA